MEIPTAESLHQMSEAHREQAQEKRLDDYKIARDEFFEVLMKNDPKARMEAAAHEGKFHAVLYTFSKNEEGLYNDSEFFGKSDTNVSGIPFGSVWRPRGIIRAETLLTKLYTYFQTESESRKRLVFYVTRDRSNPNMHHVIVDWSDRPRFASSAPVTGSSVVRDTDGFTTVRRGPFRRGGDTVRGTGNTGRGRGRGRGSMISRT